MKKIIKWTIVIVAVGVAFVAGTRSGFRSGRAVGLMQLEFMLKRMHDDTSKLTTEEYKSIWQAEGLKPQLYSKAAYFIMKEMGRSNVWLTPGNVIQTLGTPSGSNVNGYQGTDAPRLTLWFKNNKVFLNFSMLGPLESVLSEVGHERQTGWGFSEDFPATIPEIEWPLVSGVFRKADPPASLILKAESLSAGLKTEAAWYPVVRKHFKDYPPPETPLGLDIPCKSHMMIVDGLRNDLARITFSIKGENQYWSDTWWHFTNGQWTRLPPHEGAELIAKKKETQPAI